LWDAATGGLIRTFEGHSLWVNSVVFAPDGGRLLSGGGDETIKLWDPSSGALILTFNSGDAASVAFSPDGASVPIGSAFGAAAAPARSRGSSLLFGVDAGLERCKLSLRDLLLVPEPNECRGHFGICLDYAGEPVAERRAEERDEVSGSFAVAELLRANRQCLG
jgi:hypothetical protein